MTSSTTGAATRDELGVRSARNRRVPGAVAIDHRTVPAGVLVLPAPSEEQGRERSESTTCAVDRVARARARAVAASRATKVADEATPNAAMARRTMATMTSTSEKPARRRRAGLAG